MSEGSPKMDLDTVSIQPGPSILSVLRYLNYKPWFALAEFVDNSIQSYSKNRELLKSVYGPDTFVKVTITIDPSAKRITITDNACGIDKSDFFRAFRPAAIPPDTTGLSEFGMGMKSAACWFSPKWEVRTKALGDDVERKVSFDVNQIVEKELESLKIVHSPAEVNSHYTEVILDDLHHVPVTKSIGKIKDHLTDIYRVFIEEGKLQLYLNDVLLEYKEPKILTAPYFGEKNGKSKLWRKDIDIDLGNGQHIKGFAALRERGKYSKSGFSLFRRNRLIQEAMTRDTDHFQFSSSGAVIVRYDYLGTCILKGLR